ncbi:MAG: thioredoxin domain-containing protein, partial [Pseudomonadota bacterium]
MDVGHRIEEPPGTTRAPDVTAALNDAYQALGASYVPRTHLLGPDGRARFVNRLIREASPYLRQHAHNPVDWRPWSDETLSEAAARDMPIFLSVGYATCHWCHVMEEESFDDEQVAALLNAHFLPVKLDREQRPDLDQIYISATQLQQGHAGWPNSVWLMPDGRP